MSEIIPSPKDLFGYTRAFKDPNVLTYRVADHSQPVARVVAFNAEGEILMCQRAENSVWELPGGKVDPGEELHIAGARETAEEAGIITITDEQPVTFEIRPMHGKAPYGGLHYHASVVAALQISGEAQPLHETSAVAWIDPTNIDSLGQIRPDTYKALAALGLR